MEPSVYTKILQGELPGQIIYEDDTSVAILTIQPLSRGHLLVIPKEQVDHLWDVDNETYHHLFDVAKQLAALLKKTYAYERVGVIVEGYGVPHAHIHVFGLEQQLEPTIIATEARKRETGKHFADAEVLAVVADELRANL